MFGLRRWHKQLIASEAIAGLIVIWAYHDIVDNQFVFLGGLGGTAILSPGLRLFGWPSVPFYPAVCLVTAAIYTGVIFGFWTVGRLALLRLRHLRAAHPHRTDVYDLDRYLR